MVLCDLCMNEIDSLNDGRVIWDWDPGDEMTFESVSPIVIHQDCFSKIKKEISESSGSHFYSMPVKDFLMSVISRYPDSLLVDMMTRNQLEN